MQAIILAAGMGKRLGNLTKDNTKCMVKVNGIPLIDRVLGQLSHFPLSKVILVIGYKGEKLKEYLGFDYQGLPIQYIENSIYDKTNNIYSLSLAKKELQEDDTLLIESDLIFDDTLFPMILNDPYPNLALVAKYETWMDGTMVRLDDENNIVNFIPKKAFKYSDVDCYYKTVNIYKFSKEFSRTHYVPFLEAYTKALGNNEYYEQVLRVITLLDKCELKALPLDGQKWYEIDDVQDLDIAETLFANSVIKLSRYQKRYGGYWRFPALLDYCYLVNPFFPTQRMRDEIKANFDVLLTEYPSGMSVNSLLIGKYFGVNPDYVCVGNGAAELIKSLMEYLPGTIGVIYPTFEEYPNRCNKQEVVVYIPSNPDFSYRASDVMSYYSDKKIDSLLIVNPDNPSGNFIPYTELLSLCEWAGFRSIRLIVDESFVDFAEDGLHQPLLLHLFGQREGVAAAHTYGFGQADERCGIPGPVHRADADAQLLEALTAECLRRRLPTVDVAAACNVPEAVHITRVLPQVQQNLRASAFAAQDDRKHCAQRAEILFSHRFFLLFQFCGWAVLPAAIASCSRCSSS